MSEENNTPQPPAKRMRLDANFFAAMASASKATKKQSGPPPPLPIEPCTIQRLKEHRTLLQTEIDEYRDLLRTKMAEMDQTNDRIDYLQSVRKKRLNKEDKRKCITEGCNKFAQRLGLCNEHGASKIAKICIFEGCTNHAKQKGGLCRKHGVRTYCETAGCNRLATKGNLCNIHRTDFTPNRLYCTYNEDEEGTEGRCWNHRKRGVYCARHWKLVCKCISPNCNNEAVGKSRSCKFCLELEKAATTASSEQGGVLDGTLGNDDDHHEDDNVVGEEDVARGSGINDFGDDVQQQKVQPQEDSHDVVAD